MPKQNPVGETQELMKDIVIIGTGFGGLGMAIKLKEAGLHDFVILEKSESVGGCWRENTYPGAACDVPSTLYSFSFEPKTNWSRFFAPQGEILDYLKHCADKYTLHPHIQFGKEVVSADFDADSGLWAIRTKDGALIRSRFFISACGQLSRPAYPNLPGIDKFKGKVMHSAKWDHDYDLAGKKVAVIGTGASAIQFVPEIATQVENMQVFQRTAPYIISKPDRAYTKIEHALFKKWPLLQKIRRGLVYSAHEVRFLGFSVLQKMMFMSEFYAMWHMKKTIKDPELRKKFTPDYKIGCKRILISNNYYEAFTRENVGLETTAIAEIDEQGVVMKDGRRFDVDAIIYGTGFKATEFLSPMEISGIDNKDLNEVWRQGAESYLGITINDFPNLFMLYGPNTNLGHNSIIYMLESQIQYTLESIKAVYKNKLKFLNTRKDVQTIYNAKVQDQVKGTVWENGCTSWYRTDGGKNTNNWPDFTFNYRKMTKSVDMNDFEAEPLS